ncbi:MAG: hypothetical protein BGN85_05295 [Alphaproteobacteria bacterium 64-11]|nr:MAG: hypothetical protein BGN85_05295 [Alphaproteobacteria bacterium 64-11]
MLRRFDKPDIAATLAHLVIGQDFGHRCQFPAFGYQTVQDSETAAFRQSQPAHFGAPPPLSTCVRRAVAGRAGRCWSTGAVFMIPA